MDPENAVTCPVCGERTSIPEHSISAYCASGKCTKHLLLKPATRGYRYVMTICKEKLYYSSAKTDAEAFTELCCKEEFIINENQVMEVRNNQLITGTERKTPLPSNNELIEELTGNIMEDAKKIDKLRAENDSLVKKVAELEKKLGLSRVRQRIQPLVTDFDYANKKSDIFGAFRPKQVRRRADASDDHQKEVESNLNSVGVDQNKPEKKEDTKDTINHMETEKRPQNENSNRIFMLPSYRKGVTLQTLEDRKQQGIKNVAELNAEKSSDDVNAQDNDVIILKQEIKRLNVRILEDSAKYDELKKNMELIPNEKIQLLNQLAVVNTLYQTATLNGNRMVEQINALIMTNLNLSAKGRESYRMADKKENGELLLAPEAMQNKGPLLVSCDICRVVAPIPVGEWKTCCSQSYCPGNGTLILAPVEPGYRIVRRVCKNVCKYSLVPNYMKNIQCGCCKRDYNIVDTVVEIRNGQKIYKTILPVLAEDELEELENYKLDTEMRLTNLENELKKERKEANELRIENAELEFVREKLDAEVKKMEETLKGAREEFSDVCMEKMLLEDLRYELEDKLKNLELEMKKHREELEELYNQKMEHDEIREKLATLEEGNKNLSEELEVLRNERMSKQVDRMKLSIEAQDEPKEEKRTEKGISDENVVRLTEINKLLMKKIKEFESGKN